MWASKEGHVSTVKLLLDRGADIHQKNKVRAEWVGMDMLVYFQFMVGGEITLDYVYLL